MALVKQSHLFRRRQDSCLSLLWAADENPASDGDGPAWLPSVVTVLAAQKRLVHQQKRLLF